MRRLIACLPFLLILFAAWTPDGRSQVAEDVIHACSDSYTGGLRIVTEPERCKPSETAISWNSGSPRGTAAGQAPPGPRGLQGASGMKETNGGGSGQAPFQSRVYIDDILLVAAVASMIVGLMAIWLAIFFHRSSARLLQETREAAQGIALSAERLGNLLDKLYADALSPLKSLAALQQAAHPPHTATFGDSAPGKVREGMEPSAQQTEGPGRIYITVPTPPQPKEKTSPLPHSLRAFHGKRLEDLLEHDEIAEAIKKLTGKYYIKLLENLRASGKIAVDSAGDATISGTASHLDAIEEAMLHLDHDGGIHAAILTQGEKVLYFTNRDESRSRLISPVQQFLRRFNDIKVIFMNR